jgi:hypothetical protein
MKGHTFLSKEAVKTFLLEIWVRMDSGQLFSAFNEWMKRLQNVIESEGKYYTQ